MIRNFWTGMRASILNRLGHSRRIGSFSKHQRASGARSSRIEPLEPRVLLAADTLVISELMAVNDGTLLDEDGEFEDWIEIHNPTAAAIDLEGWHLTDDPDDLSRWSFPSTTIDAGQYLLVFASNKDRLGAELHTDFKLGGNGEFLALVQPDGVTIASEYRPEYPSQLADISYGMSSDMTEVGYFTTPTPAAANLNDPIADPSKQIVISEIMYHPASENPQDEFIELYNRGTESVQLADWQITSGVEFTFPRTTLAPGDYLAVAADLASFSALHPNVNNVVGPWTGKLSNSSETITLVNDADERMDRVEYADQGDWSVRERGPDDRGTRGWIWSDAHDGGGKSLELINLDVSNRRGQNWQASIPDRGTPGAANSAAESDIAPFIIDVRHAPIIPRSNEEVNVTARILDDLGENVFASVHWRVDGAANFTILQMQDDGLNGDGIAGDGIFGATLPAQTDGTIIEFYVQAGDSSRGGNLRSWPAAVASGEQSANALYQVDDTPPNTELPVYRTIMTEAERAEFAAITRQSDAQMNATFISSIGGNEQVRYTAGLRIRGSASRNSNPPPNRINLPSDFPWQGITQLNLNSVGPQDQVAGSALFGLAGLPAADALSVEYLVNGTDLAGGSFYAHLEPLNSEWAENHYPEDNGGNLYKGRRPNESPPGGQGAGLRYFGPDPAPYVSYTKLTNSSEADWSDVINLTFQLNNSPDDTYLQDVGQVVNIEQWLRFFALNALLGNTEGGLVTGDNQGDDYAMYRGIEDPRFLMVPHDLDSLFSNVNQGIFRAAGVPALNRLMRHPEILPRYYAQIVDLLDNVLTPDKVRPVLEEMLGNAVSNATINNMVNYLQNRADFVRTLIPLEFTLNTNLPNLGGFPRTTSPQISLNGQADAVNTRSVTVNGRLATWNPENGQWAFNDSGQGDLLPIIELGSEWNYLDDGSNQGTAWRELNFDDSSWASGPAQLGYGDGDERTEVNGGPAGNRIPTTYFRGYFNQPQRSEVTSMNLMLQRDDGAVVYLNGQEVARSNMPDGEIDFQTRSLSGVSGGEENQLFEFAVDPGLMVRGENVLAVEIHQTGPTSSDISFDLALTAVVASGNNNGSLQPGINRVTVQTFDGSAGSGNELTNTQVDIWYDDGNMSEISGTLADDTTLSAAVGPWHVTEDLIVPEGISLTIQPGASVYFDEGVELLVQGTLIAQGEDFARIRLTSVPNAPLVPDEPNGRGGLPDGPPRWAGVHFVDTMSQENVLSHVDFENAQSLDGSIGAVRSQVLVDNVTFRGTHLRMINTNAASMTIRNSIFPDMFSGNESPQALGLDNISEHIKGIGRPPQGGHYIIENNFFGTNRGHNDVIDINSGRRPQPIAQILNNVFTGSGDELLDLGGDVYIAGNIFLNVFKDNETSERGYASAISTGDAGRDTTIALARNFFWNVDHGINLKQGTSTIFENNTVSSIRDDFVDRFGTLIINSAVNFYTDELNAVPGDGAYASGNIFWDIPRIFGNIDLPEGTVSQLELTQNFLAPELGEQNVGQRLERILELGPGNLTGNPSFVDEMIADLRLGPGSAAESTGPFGRDFGASAPAGAWITGEPSAVTASTTASLTVGGPGIFAFQYRVDGGPWSEEIPIGDGFNLGSPTVRTAEIELTGLSDGLHFVEVLGQDFAGVWQETPTVSKSWTIDTGSEIAPQIKINEVLAQNFSIVGPGDTISDMVELFNAGDQTVDLAGMGISDRDGNPTMYVFPAETLLAPGEYLVLIADSEPSVAGEIHLGFGLQSGGEGVFLFDSTGTMIDSVDFGLQLDNLSIGRLANGSWGLSVPTFGSQNISQPLADADSLKINEWFTRGKYVIGEKTFKDDFIELYNGESLPVSLAGLFLTDNFVSQTTKHQIADLSFIEAGGYAVFTADGKTNSGPDHVDFNLAAERGWIGLFDSKLNPLDRILYGPQSSGVSQGRLPDGGENFEFFSMPTPGIDATPPSVPSGLNFTLLSENRIDFQWQESSDPETGIAFYRVFRNGDLLATTMEPNFSDTAVLPDIPYSYRVSAVNFDGIASELSSPLNSMADISPPTVPSGLRSSVVNNSQIDLRWDLSSDPETGVQFYSIYRDGALLGTSTTPVFSDVNARIGAPVSYSVSASNGDSIESAQSISLEVTMFQDGAAPSANYAGTRDTFIFSSNPTSTAGAFDSTIDVDGSVGGSPEQEVMLLKWNLTSGPAAGSIVQSASLTFNITEGAAHEHVFFAALKDWTEAEATWQEASSGNAWEIPGAGGTTDRETIIATVTPPINGTYSIDFNAAGLELIQSWIDNPAENLGIIMAASPGSVDGFTISAREDGSSINRPRLTISTISQTLDETPPSTPTGLSATDNGFSQVSLTWNAADDPETGIQKYNIYRNSTLIGSSSSTSFVDNNVSPDTPYQYQVSAVNGHSLEGSLSSRLQYQFESSLPDFSISLSTRNSYLPGVPVLVQVSLLGDDGRPLRDLWDTTVTLSTDNPAATLSTDQVVIRNGRGSALVNINDAGDVNLTASLGSFQAERTITSLQNVPQSTVSGVLPGSSSWNGVIHVTGDVTIPAGETLSIRPGTLILVDGTSDPLDENGIDINVFGMISSLGTSDRPITFTASDPDSPWGELNHDSSDASLYQFTNITRAGHSPRGGHTNTGPAIRSANGSEITFEHTAISDIAGKIMQADDSELVFSDSHLSRAVMGPEIDDSSLLLERTYITEMLGIFQEDGRDPDDNDGIYLHSQRAGQEIRLVDSVIAAGNDDGIDTLGSDVTVENVIVRDFDDKGISVNNGSVNLSDSLFINHDIGISVKTQGGIGPAIANLDGLTIVGPNRGIQIEDKFGIPNAIIQVDLVNSIVRTTNPIITDYDPADITVNYSNLSQAWPGTGNTTLDPLFVDPSQNNYRLSENSPAVDSGDPNSEPDPDGSRADMGALPLLQSSTVPRVIDVLVTGQFWSPRFTNYLELTGMGTGGYSIPGGPEPEKPLPWSGIDTIQLVFDQDVTIQAADLNLRGLNVSDYQADVGLAADGFNYDQATNTASWTLVETIDTDRLRISLPSGFQNNAGEAFEFDFSVFPGDASRNSTVDTRDVQLLRQSLLSFAGDPNYSLFADFDASGTIDIRDLQPLRDHLLQTLPQGQLAVLSTELAVEDAVVDALPNDRQNNSINTDSSPKVIQSVYLEASRRRLVDELMIAGEESLSISSQEQSEQKTENWQHQIDSLLEDDSFWL